MKTIDETDVQSTRCIYVRDKYRYRLEYCLDNSEILKTCLIIMHNPSRGLTRNGDKTLTRLDNKLRYNHDQFKIGRVIICNLVPYIEPDKETLKSAFQNNVDIFGENDWYLSNAVQESDFIIAAWGNADGYSFILKKLQEYKSILVKDTFCFYKTVRNFPSHPLWKSDEVILQSYSIP
jgi:hypothetical protein